MRQCKQCGATFLSGETLCAYCGTPLVPGAKQEDQKSRRQRKKQERQSGPQWDYSAFEQDFHRQRGAPPPLRMFARRRWDSFIAACLAFTLGTFGAHWFYLDNPRRGMLHAVFFWPGIPTIIGLIDGVRLLKDAVSEDYF